MTDAEDTVDTTEAVQSNFGYGNHGGKGNVLPVWGNKQSMNLNSLILDNIMSSPYFKNNLFQLKTFHEVVDEIYYNVDHLEPWERGTRRQVGNSGARAMEVRGVGAGGVVSTPFCILYKLYTLKLTRKQLTTLLDHPDSPYIRGLGFLFVRFALSPHVLWEWFEPYLNDEEEIDPKAGGGDKMTVGQMAKLMLVKLDWYSTLFPRIPVPVQKDLEVRLREYNRQKIEQARMDPAFTESFNNVERGEGGGTDHSARERHRSPTDRRRRSRTPEKRRRSRSRTPERRRRSRSNEKRRRSRSRSKEREKHRAHKHKKRSRSRS